MKNNTKMKVMFPAILSIIFFINAALPVTVLGCANRGLVAIIIALISGIAALVTAIIAMKIRMSGESESTCWIISTLIFTIPVIALIILG